MIRLAVMDAEVLRLTVSKKDDRIKKVEKLIDKISGQAKQAYIYLIYYI